MTTVGRIVLDFGDWGSAGRIAILVEPLAWRGITVPAGFMSDGASVPRPLWWFLPPWGDRATAAALIHDYLCDMLDRGKPVAGYASRALCDRAYFDALIDLGVSRPRAVLCWAGVRTYSILHVRAL
ncbi:DUF1353 domain-containing protein [Arsenicitalea aurantiaca]|uniref:DUF1353 domain-containing protein n=1 Tax=Arsenicitalea aurantiaca TaxID=1783274 RepID=A0A433XFC3_9HYPH|nr:DUF1353 domain-containing protein [Arsenicitalea aurantiaca]RUT32648.1 DUF1353 domain-containing protein [Arsenicitalea aurantiaca]